MPYKQDLIAAEDAVSLLLKFTGLLDSLDPGNWILKPLLASKVQKRSFLKEVCKEGLRTSY